MPDVLRAVVFESDRDVSDYIDEAEQAVLGVDWDPVVTCDPEEAIERLAGSAALIASLWTRDIVDATRIIPVLPAGRLISASNEQLRVPRLILSPGMGGRVLVRPGSRDKAVAKESSDLSDQITGWLRFLADAELKTPQ